MHIALEVNEIILLDSKEFFLNEFLVSLCNVGSKVVMSGISWYAFRPLIPVSKIYSKLATFYCEC